MVEQDLWTFRHARAERSPYVFGTNRKIKYIQVNLKAQVVVYSSRDNICYTCTEQSTRKTQPSTTRLFRTTRTSSRAAPNHVPIPYSTMLYHTIICHTTPYHTTPSATLRFATLSYYALPSPTIKHHKHPKKQYHTTQYHAVPHHRPTY